MILKIVNSNNRAHVEISANLDASNLEFFVEYSKEKENGHILARTRKLPFVFDFYRRNNLFEKIPLNFLTFLCEICLEVQCIDKFGTVE